MNNYKVYKHTSPSEKVYIGITKQEPKQRWGNGSGYYKQVFHLAIKKYGWDNITSEILFENLSLEQACKKEMELIASYRSNNSNFGYNASPGGEFGLSHTSESIKQTLQTKINKDIVKLNWDIAKLIRSDYNNRRDGKLLELATKYEVSTHTIKRVLLNTAWCDEEYKVIYVVDKDLDKEEVKEMREIYNSSNTTQEQLAEKFNRSIGGVHKVVTNQTWHDEEYEKVRRMNYAHKMDWELVGSIRQMGKDNNITHKEIGDKFSIDRVTVTNILNNNTWVDKEYVNERVSPTNKLNIEVAREIRKLYSETDISHRGISKKYGIARSTVHSILNNKTWKETT